MGVLMIKAIVLALLTVCICWPGLYAQEVAGRGWTVSESRQHASNTILVGSGQSPAHLSSMSFMPSRIESGEGDEQMPPFPVLMPKTIVYPRKAVRKGWEGQTVVAAEILPDGSVGRTALARSSGHEALDQAAEEAIQSWKFGTELEQDKAVPHYVDIPVTFKLQNGE